MAWYDDIGNGMKAAWDGVTGYVKFCGENIKDGWSAVGDFYSMAGDDFKNGAWVGGLGNGLMGTLSVLGAAGNTLLGGNLKAAGDAIFDNTVDFSYEDGTVHLTAQEDNSFLGNLAANTLGKFVETGVNAELEMDEAIQEGDIDKANKMGGIVLAEGASIPAIAFATVFGGEAIAAGGSAIAGGIGAASTAGTLSAGTVAASVGSGIMTAASTGGVGLGVSSVATWALGGINEHNHTAIMIDTPKDYYSDTADGFVQKMIEAGYIDANDTASIEAYKEATEIHLSGQTGGNEDIYRNLLIAAQDDGKLNIAKDFFVEQRKDDAEFKETTLNNLSEYGIDVSTLSEDQKNEYFDSVVNAYAAYDVAEIDFNGLQRQMTTNNNVLLYTLADPEMSKEDAEYYANLDTELAFGDINEKSYYKQILTRSLENSTGMTSNQIDAYSDYMADVNLGEISQQEAVELMAKDPDLSSLFDKEGNLVLPAKTETENQVSVQAQKTDELVKPSGMPESDWVKYKAYLESKQDGNTGVTSNQTETQQTVSNERTDNGEVNKTEASETMNKVPEGAVEIINSDWSSKYGDNFTNFINVLNAKVMSFSPEYGEKLINLEANFFKSHDLEFSVAEKDVSEMSVNEIAAQLKEDALETTEETKQETQAPEVSDTGLAFE